MSGLKTMLVSICVPTYNRPNLIGKLLNSILQQTYQNFEIIITDNSDNDLTKNLIMKLYRDKRIRYYKNEKNLGMDGNSLKALSLVNGEFFTFTPDDDIWIDKNKLESQVSILNQANLNCCFSNALHTNPDGTNHNNQFKTISGNGCSILSSKDLLITQKPEHFVCILTGLIRSTYLDLFIHSWRLGSEELFMWYLGGIGENICFCYDQMVAIRDGEHNWQINSGNGELINYKNNSARRSLQIYEKYAFLIKKHGNKLKLFDRSVEVKISIMLINLIQMKAFQYINTFRKVNYFDKAYFLTFALLKNAIKTIIK